MSIDWYDVLIVAACVLFVLSMPALFGGIWLITRMRAWHSEPIAAPPAQPPRERIPAATLVPIEVGARTEADDN